jgi:hypothetical protein
VHWATKRRLEVNPTQDLPLFLFKYPFKKFLLGAIWICDVAIPLPVDGWGLSELSYIPAITIAAYTYRYHNRLDNMKDNILEN